jgi:hypothetical protein
MLKKNNSYSLSLEENIFKRIFSKTNIPKKLNSPEKLIHYSILYEKEDIVLSVRFSKHVDSDLEEFYAYSIKYNTANGYQKPLISLCIKIKNSFIYSTIIFFDKNNEIIKDIILKSIFYSRVKNFIQKHNYLNEFSLKGDLNKFTLLDFPKSFFDHKKATPISKLEYLKTDFFNILAETKKMLGTKKK